MAGSQKRMYSSNEPVINESEMKEIPMLWDLSRLNLYFLFLWTILSATR